MSNLYRACFINNGIKRWGLFYDDSKGVKQALYEDFKQVFFDNEMDAEDKLATIEAERKSEDSAVAFSKEEAKMFAESHRWKFATTYAITAPHEYLVKKWLGEEDRLLFERLVQTINAKSDIGYFYGHKNKYLILGDYYYWYMPFYPDNMAVDLINRTTVDNLEYRDGAYFYKGKGDSNESDRTEG